MPTVTVIMVVMFVIVSAMLAYVLVFFNRL
jgi:hypothetical protein